MKRAIWTAVFVLTSVAMYALDATEIVEKAEAAFLAERIWNLSRMTTYRGERQTREYTFETYSLTDGDETRSLVIYTEPERMRGTAYLSVGDELWVRFASTGRVRMLGSLARRESAGGSDFSYEDLGGGGGMLKSFSVRLVSDRERRDGVPCYEVEFTPLPNSDTAYDRIVGYIAKDDIRYVAIEYFESGAHTKTMTLGDYRQVGDIDYPFMITMRSEVSSARTEIATLRMEVNPDNLNEDMFTVEYLENME